MLRNVMIGGIALVSSCAASAPAYAEPVCGPREKIVPLLESNYDEVSVAVGLTTDSMVEIFASEGGTFTIMLTLPDGRSCLIASGSHFMLSIPEPRGEDL